jgi:FMNH2-dependent dimethyl sulfone monooxygenase
MVVSGIGERRVLRVACLRPRRELARVTDVSPRSPGFGNYQDWVQNTQLESRVSLEDYSVSNRGLRAGFVGTPEQVAERVRSYQEAGVDLVLLQASPPLEEMERFAETVMPLVPSVPAAAATPPAAAGRAA